MSDLPEGWDSRTLISLADYLNGAAFKPIDWVEEGLPIVRIEQINNQNAETDKFDGFVHSSNLIDTGDLIFSWSATLKAMIWRGGPAVLNQHLYKVVPKADVHKKLLLQVLDHNMEKLAGQSQGSTMKHVTRKELSKFRVPFPNDPNHQKKIAAILETVDLAIEQTEALIAKYEQVKAGMMQDLFTRGLTAQGKLRPTRQQAPNQYQKTPIGWIPKEWAYGKCENYCERICVGIVIRPAEHYKSDGVATLRSANVRENAIDNENLVFISETSNTLLQKSQIRTGDIITVRTGYPGTSAVVSPTYDRCNCVDILISTPSENIDPIFLCYWVNSTFGKWQVLRKQGGLAQQHFNVGEMRELLVVQPNKTEQNDIVLRLNSINDRVLSEVNLLAKLRQQKSGLMHDLLTGTVAVKV